jgi:hypothetical protein
MSGQVLFAFTPLSLPLSLLPSCHSYNSYFSCDAPIFRTSLFSSVFYIIIIPSFANFKEEDQKILSKKLTLKSLGPCSTSSISSLVLWNWTCMSNAWQRAQIARKDLPTKPPAVRIIPVAFLSSIVSKFESISLHLKVVFFKLWH